MKRLLAAIGMVLLLAPIASAHPITQEGYAWDEDVRSEKRAQIVRSVNNNFTKDWRRHHTMKLFECETNYRYWLRGTYDGLPQMNESAMQNYAINNGQPYWSIPDQVKSFKNMWKQVGSSHWPNCP